jgi:hypothetical protein
MALYKHRIEREIRKRDEVLFALSSSVEWLLRISRENLPAGYQPRDFNAADIRNILEPVGLALDAGAIGIFKADSWAMGSETVSLMYEWGSPAHESCLYKPELKQFSFSSLHLSRWHNLLVKGGVISSMLSDLPPEEKQIFFLLGVKSGVIVPIFIRDNFWGFIGFFDLDERIRSPDEIEALRITANLLGAAMGYR